MWLISGNMAYNTEQFGKIAVKDTNVVGYTNGAEVILRHFAFEDDAKNIFKDILRSIEQRNKTYYL